ncbi:hypothetical protein ACFL47_01140 [Candidatus Latescibacterota bacterium]
MKHILSYLEKIHRLRKSELYNSTTALILRIAAIFMILLYVCMTYFPITVDSLYYYAQNEQVVWGYRYCVHSNVHDRLFEKSPDFDYPKLINEKVSVELENIKKEPLSNIGRIVKFIKTYNKSSIKLHSADYPSAWEYRYAATGMGHYYSYSVPFSWLLEKFGLSEIVFSLAVLCGAWLGIVCLFLITRRMTGSSIAGLSAVVFFVYLCALFRIVHVAYILNIFSVMWIGQHWAGQNRNRLLKNPIVKYVFEIAVYVLFGFYSVLFLFFYPNSWRINCTLVVATLFLLGIVKRNKRIIFRALSAAVVVFVFQFPFNNYSFSLFKPISSFNSASGQEFVLPALIWMTYERPTHYGLPHGDPVQDWVADLDPYTKSVSRMMNIHQVTHFWGRTYSKDIMLKRPWYFVEVWWKRLYEQLAFHKELSFEMYHDNRGLGILLFYVTVFLCGYAVLKPDRISSIWPLASVALFQVFGLSTIFTVIHTHSNYFSRGVFSFYALFPGLFFFFVFDIWGKFYKLLKKHYS